MDGVTPDARAVVALLANDEARAMIARITLGQGLELATARERRTLDRLVAAGVVIDEAGILGINTAGLRAAVETYSPARPEGIDRFIRDGRIVNYPASDADRLAVLEWVGARVLEPEEQTDEAELNKRLHPYMDEHVLLRRYLVDYGVLKRDADGTRYRLAEGRSGAT